MLLLQSSAFFGSEIIYINKKFIAYASRVFCICNFVVHKMVFVQPGLSYIIYSRNEIGKTTAERKC